MKLSELLAEGRVPLTDDEFDFETDDLTGVVLVNYDETTYTSGDETFIEEVRGAEIVAFSGDDGTLMTRDHLAEIVGRSVLDHFEEVYAERRMESM